MNNATLIAVAAKMAEKDGYALYRERAAELLRQMEEAGMVPVVAEEQSRRTANGGWKHIKKRRKPLTPDERAEAQALWLAGWTGDDIAKMFGISAARVYQIGSPLRRRSNSGGVVLWADTGEPVVRPAKEAAE